MEKRTGVVTFAGGPITLVGPEIKVGQQAPDFTVLSNDLQAKTLKDFEGKVKVISV
ncbi:MAG: thiol peroxidase, partial [Veillonella sp.]|nr:thiol peroxidase [Veillonella sp.]